MDLIARLRESSLPDETKALIMSDRLQHHLTGVKAVLADHKAIKALEKAEREQDADKRQAIIDRIIHGAKSQSQATANQEVSPSNLAILTSGSMMI